MIAALGRLRRRRVLAASGWLLAAPGRLLAAPGWLLAAPGDSWRLPSPWDPGGEIAPNVFSRRLKALFKTNLAFQKWLSAGHAPKEGERRRNVDKPSRNSWAKPLGRSPQLAQLFLDGLSTVLRRPPRNDMRTLEKPQGGDALDLGGALCPPPQIHCGLQLPRGPRE